jgi:hypothetical protein
MQNRQLGHAATIATAACLDVHSEAQACGHGGLTARGGHAHGPCGAQASPGRCSARRTTCRRLGPRLVCLASAPAPLSSLSRQAADQHALGRRPMRRAFRRSFGHHCPSSAPLSCSVKHDFAQLLSHTWPSSARFAHAMLVHACLPHVMKIVMPHAMLIICRGCRQSRYSHLALRVRSSCMLAHSCSSRSRPSRALQQRHHCKPSTWLPVRVQGTPALSQQVTCDRQETECATPQLATNVSVCVLSNAAITTTESTHHNMQLWTRTGCAAHPAPDGLCMPSSGIAAGIRCAAAKVRCADDDGKQSGGALRQCASMSSYTATGSATCVCRPLMLLSIGIALRAETPLQRRRWLCFLGEILHVTCRRCWRSCAYRLCNWLPAHDQRLRSQRIGLTTQDWRVIGTPMACHCT